jgi:CDP-diacylglycerol--glycerol-3-phosphate 3-phosphatidyltransferase
MDGSLPSPNAYAQQLAPPTDEVSKKLRGGVWEKSELARAVYSGLLSFGRWLAELGVTPNSLTYCSLALALASGVAAAAQLLFKAAGLLLASGAFDLLDGVVARAGQRSSRFGALLDSTVDRLSDALPLIGLMIAYTQRPLASAVLAIAMMTGFAVSYVRARAEGLGIQLPTLFMRRAERVVLLLAALVAGGIKLRSFPSEVAMLSIVAVMGALSLVAAVWAMRAAYVMLEPRRPSKVGASSPAAPTPSRP